MKLAKAVLLACTATYCSPLMAAEATDGDKDEKKPDVVIVTAAREASAASKTDTPLIRTPQAVTIVKDDLYLSQGAVSIADTLRYVSGVQANAYGPDTRVDGT